jgi:predicted transport protein
MAKTSGDFEKELLDTSKEKTGKSVNDWLELIKNSGIKKRNDILEWLKKGHGLNHMQAQLITGIFLNNGKPVYIDQDNLLENQFVKFPEMRRLYDEISKKITGSFSGAQLIPKKTYLSFTAVREFAAVNVKKGMLRLGMDLGDMPFDNKITKSKLTGPMPRISHMAEINDIKQLEKELMKLLETSYNRTHKK